jgi:DNA-binding GntR family transcriptional regulator
VAPGILIREKTSAAVLDYILQELFEGRLKTGDRIDLDEISATLGISRLPVREALVILERDGIVSTRYHRGVFVEPFDAQSIIDDFEIMGTLSGLAVSRLAANPDPEVIASLQQLMDELRAVNPDDARATYLVVEQILILEHRAGGSRRLKAELRSHAGFLPAAFQVGVNRGHALTVKAHARVLRAIIAADGARAAQYRQDDFRDAGKRVARELERRGIF